MDNDGDGQNSEGIQFQPNKTEIFLVILVKDSPSTLSNCSLSLLYLLSLAFFFPTEQKSLFFFKLLWLMDGYYIIYIYIIAEDKRKLIPTYKEALTNKKKDSLKCYHVYRFLVKQLHVTMFGLSKLCHACN